MARWPAHLCMGAWINMNMEPALCEKEESKARKDPASHQDVGPARNHCIPLHPRHPLHPQTRMHRKRAYLQASSLHSK